ALSLAAGIGFSVVAFMRSSNCEATITITKPITASRPQPINAPIVILSQRLLPGLRRLIGRAAGIEADTGGGMISDTLRGGVNGCCIMSGWMGVTCTGWVSTASGRCG